MRSVLFKVFGLPIYAFGAAICLAFMQAFWLTRFLIARDHRDPPYPKGASEEEKKAFLEWIYDLGFGAMVGAIVGARLFHVLFEGQGQKYIDHPLEFFKVWNGGLVWYGGFIGAFLTCLWMVVRKKVHPWQLGDFVAPAISFGYAIGRLGCFMNGCCYGRPSEKWGVVFEEIGDHVHRIPTQLYESASGLAIGLFLIWLLPRRKFRGQVWWAYVSLYAIARFTVEIWRDDPRGEYGPLMTSQWIALLMFPIGVAAYFYQRAKGRIPASPVAVEKS
ncbi:MAG: prolipoprotein diacylglyceryl transferase [Planctomycetes bacterium]|nr:prolipoprotein diacylglyceryl transferase [Planctomycetota bacterium]